MTDVGDDKAKTKAEEQRRLRLAAENESAIENGRLALHEFRQWPEETNLEKDDLRAIAENLQQMLGEIKADRGELTKLFESAGLNPQEKARMTQKKGAPLNKELRAKKKQYQVLLEKWSDQQIGNEISLRAERMLRGTQFYPLDRADLEDARLMMKALQVAVDRIDREFNLWEMCQTVAAIREPLEAPYQRAVRDCDETALSKFSDENPSHVGNPIRLWWPIDEDRLWDYDENKPLLPDNAFWVSSHAPHDPYAAGVWSGEEIFFFPHVYLGPAVEWRGWVEYIDGYAQSGLSDSCRQGIISEVLAAQEPQVLFNQEAGSYQVCIDNPETGELASAADWGWGGGSHSDNACRWLVIYPDPNTKELVPAIYMRGTYSTVELRPLSETMIAEWGNRERWQYLGHDGADTLLQRVKNLTGFGANDFKIMDAWRETAARFHLNPIFRSHQDEADKVLYRRHLKRWITHGQRILEDDEQK